MAIAKRTRSAQYPLVADFVFNYNDGFPVLATLNAASQDTNPRPTITDFGSKAQRLACCPVRPTSPTPTPRRTTSR